MSTITGTTGSDYLTGTTGNDSIIGLAEYDVIYGGGGNDTLDGGDGYDVILGQAGNDSIIGGAGDDVLTGGSSTTSGEDRDTILGGDGNDLIYGNWDNDLIQGDAGNDTLWGNAGADTLNGGAGNDVVPYVYSNGTFPTGVSLDFSNFVSGGTSTIVDGFGDTDTLISIEAISVQGSTGNDTIIGSPFNDILEGGSGQDIVIGGDGNDSMYLISPGGTISGGNGNDYLYVASSGTVDAGAGNDIIVLQSTPSVLIGGAGQDSFVFLSTSSSAGADPYRISDFTAGVGGDVLYISAILEIADSYESGDPITAGYLRLLQSGTDTFLQVDRDGSGTLYDFSTEIVLENSYSSNIKTENYIYTLPPESIFPGLHIDALNYAVGGFGPDTITAASVDTMIYGNYGADSIVGWFGSESLNGESGPDTLEGLYGSDQINGGLGRDTAVYRFTNVSTGINFTVVPADSSGNSSQPDGSGTGVDTLYSIEIISVVGGSGNDSFTGDARPNILEGSAGNDTLIGGIGNDTLIGGDGADVFVISASGYSGPGNDIITDFSNPDLLRIDGVTLTMPAAGPTTGLLSGDVRVATSGGNTLISIGLDSVAGADTVITLSGLTLSASDLLVTGSSGLILRSALPQQSLTGTTGHDNLTGGDGNDTILGLGGDDMLIGQQGDDSILGGDGNDFIVAGSVGAFGTAANSGTVSDGNDTVDAGAGNDEVNGGAGADSLIGGDGDDTLYGSNTSASLSWNLDGADTLRGGAGNDILRGNAGNDSLDGGAGDDNLRGDAGNDTLDGGAGNDFASYFYFRAGLTSGIHVDISTFQPGAEFTFTDAFGGTDTLRNIERLGLDGTDFADTFTGSSSDDQFTAGSGNDSVEAGAGNDAAFGDAGDDTLWGGAGDDTLDGGEGNNLVDGGDGFDVASYFLWTETGNLTISAAGLSGGSGTIRGDTLTSIEAVYITGGDGHDRLTGSTGNDTLDGSNGNDTLAGGAGNDLFIIAGDNAELGGRDTILDFSPGDKIQITGLPLNTPTAGGSGGLLRGDVRIEAGSSGTTLIHVGADSIADADITITLNGSFTATDFIRIGGDMLALAAPAPQILIGTSGFDSLVGSSQNDTIIGLDGNDALVGLGGADSLDGGDGNDSLDGWGYVGVLGPPGIDGADTLDGGNGNDRLFGYEGDDSLLGGAGDDQLQGDTGNDTIDGGAGTDIAIYRFDNQDQTGGVIFSAETLTTGGSGTLSDEHGGTDTLLNIESLSITGTRFGDIITGSALADQLSGLAGVDMLQGGAGNDTLSGGAGNDSLSGGDGDDTLIGGAGSDVMLGGSGIDTAYYDLSEGASGGVFMRVSGNFVQVGDATDSLSGIERIEARGSRFADTIQGGLGSETIAGLGGNDSLVGGGGNDTFLYLARDPANGTGLLAQGIDRIADFNPGDRISVEGLTFTATGVAGGNGSTLLSGDVQSEIINGITRLYIGLDNVAGADLTIELGTAVEAANLRLAGSDITSASNLTLVGTANAEYLAGGDGDDTIQGLGGNDNLVGGRGHDNLLGGDGQDWLDGGVGNDTLDGGAGDDSVFLNQTMAAGYAITRNGDGSMTLTTSAYSTDRLVDVEGLSFTDGYVRLTVASFTGPAGTSYDGTDAFGDSITGGTGNDYLNGRNGDDLLIGGAGGDYVMGGQGNDTIQGGADGTGQNNSILIDTARYEGNFASYTISSALVGNVLTFTVTDNQPGVDDNDGTDTLTGIEALSFKDQGFVRLVPQSVTNPDGSTYVEGTLFADNMSGTAHRDSFSSVGGADTIDGGDGEDNVFFNTAIANATISRTGATVTVSIGGVTSALTNIESVGFTDGYVRLAAYETTDANGNKFIDGTDFADTLTGGTGNDYLRGNKGADSMAGGAGGDYFEGGAGNDTIDGGADGVSPAGWAVIDVARYGGNFSDYTISRTGNTVTVTDNNAADGDDGTDTLTGIEALSFKDEGFVRITAQTTTNQDGAVNVEGTRFNDSLTGTTGNDFFRPGAGTDMIDGGAGTDTVSLDLSYNAANLSSGAGGWTYSANGNVYTLTNVEALSFNDLYLRLAPVAYTSADGSRSINGTQFADDLISLAGTGNDYIDGGAGNDTMAGGAGGDYLFGGAGDDTIDGGANGTGSGGVIQIDIARFNGNIADYTITRSGGTVTVTDNNSVNGSEGTDTLTNVEGLSFHDGFIRLTPQALLSSDGLSAQTEGTQFADTLTGSSGAIADYFDGVGGNDTIDGGSGDDTVRIRANLADTTITHLAGTSFQVSFGATTLQLSNVEALSFNDTYARLTTFVSADGRTHLGTEVLGDTIDGSTGNDYIDGRAGNDVLNGGSGADIIRGGAGNDTIDGGAHGAGVDVAVYAGNFAEYTITSTGTVFTITDQNAANGEEGTDTLTGIEALQFGDLFVRIAVESVATNASASGQYIYGTILGETLNGTADGDGILGRAGYDTINAGGGDDFVDGGEGNDTIDIGDGANVVRWSSGDGNDTISGFTADDVLNIKGGITRSDASLSIAVSGGNTVITIDSISTLTLIGVTSLTDSNFGTG